jgi:hypothetical protein
MSRDRILQTCEALEERYQLDPIHLDRLDAMEETSHAPNTREAQKRVYPVLADFMEACAVASDVTTDQRAYDALVDLLRALLARDSEEPSDT